MTYTVYDQTIKRFSITVIGLLTQQSTQKSELIYYFIFLFSACFSGKKFNSICACARSYQLKKVKSSGF